MDVQHRDAVLHGSAKLRATALLVIAMKAVADAIHRGIRQLEFSAPACVCGAATALNCGDCYDALVKQR